MAIIIKTISNKSIVNEIKNKIDQGSIGTWLYDSDGDFTHVSEQWGARAWFRAHVDESNICFTIIGRKQAKLTVEEYSVYHGRFSSMLMTHFHDDISKLEMTMPLQYPLDTTRIDL